MKLTYNKDTHMFEIDHVAIEEYNYLKNHLTRKTKDFKYDKRFKLGIWDGSITLLKGRKVEYGLWNEIYECSKQHLFELKISNSSEFPIDKEITRKEVDVFCDNFFKDSLVNVDGDMIHFDPYEHQRKGAYKILKNRFCNIEVATGGGKSLIFSLTVFYWLSEVNPDAKVLLIVPRIGLVKQFYDEIKEYNNGKDGKNDNALPIAIEEIMSKNPRIDENPNIYIGTYQSLKDKSKDWLKQFEIVVCDEGHHAKANVIKSIMQKTFSTAKMRYSMTGTIQERHTLEYLTIESLTGPLVYKIGAKELIDLGILTPVDIKVIYANHNDLKFHNELRNIKKSGKGRDAYLLEKEYIQKSIRRKKLVYKLINRATANTLVLFFNIEYGRDLYNYHKDRLQNKSVYYIDGETDVDKREHIKKIFEKDDNTPKVLIASYGTFSTGINIKNLSNLILADSFKSEQIVIQSIGRILRLHFKKRKAVVIDIVDIFDMKSIKRNQNILFKHWKERERFYNKREYPYEIKNIHMDTL